MKFKLSNQAIGALMLALQKGIMEQTDITDLLQSLEFFDSVDGLIVENPPIINTDTPESIETPESNA